MSTFRLLLICLLLVLPSAAILPAATIHVPQDQPTIQAGMDAAVDGDTVLVGDGWWEGDGNRDLDFFGKAITVRSENGYQDCIIYCLGGVENHRAFFLGNGEGLDSVIEGFTIRRGSYYGGLADDKFGGGVCVIDAGVTIRGCYLNGNASRRGGGVYATGSTIAIYDSTFINNVAQTSGAGLRLNHCDSVIDGCRLIGNDTTAPYDGFGVAMHIAGGTAEVTNGLFYNNNLSYNWETVLLMGGSAQFSHCTFSMNASQWNENEIRVGGGTFNLTNSIIVGESDELIVVSEPSGFTAAWCDINTGEGTVWPGEGNIDEDPLFAGGPGGACYLSQTAAGQGADSPCVDAGDPSSTQGRGTTRTDEVSDRGRRDMGFHYPAVTQPLIATGPGPDPGNPPLVRVFPPEDDADHAFSFSAYGVPAFGVNLTVGDLDGDGIDELLTGPGPGAVFGPHVRGFDVVGTPLPGLSFLAYGTNKYGVNVGLGDLDGDGVDEIITGAGPGAVFGPHVRGWAWDGSEVSSLPGVNYFAYGTPKWGVNVAAGDIDGDGFDEIITGAGPGAVYGPHVRGWNVDGGEVSPIPGVSFFAYGTLKYGVNVTCGDLDGDGIDEIITGAGPGAVFGPHVRGWNYDGAALEPLPGYSFFAWDTEPLRFGVTVFAGADLDGDGRDDLVAGRGPDPEADTEVKVFTWDGTAVDQLLLFKAFPGWRYGTSIAAGRF